jgi:hypothetical protein
MASRAAAAALHNAGRPLAFDEDYLKEKIEPHMGTLVDSASGRWRFLPKRARTIMATPDDCKETCELIHYSVLQRYRSVDSGSFEPFPYRPINAAELLEKLEPSLIAEPSDFEKIYRS